jgi:hypothetical protein
MGKACSRNDVGGGGGSENTYIVSRKTKRKETYRKIKVYVGG